MSYFFNISVCLFLVILQTTVMPNLPLLDSFYDLLIPVIVFLGLSRPVRESLPFVFFPVSYTHLTLPTILLV